MQAKETVLQAGWAYASPAKFIRDRSEVLAKPVRYGLGFDIAHVPNMVFEQRSLTHSAWFKSADQRQPITVKLVPSIYPQRMHCITDRIDLRMSPCVAVAPYRIEAAADDAVIEQEQSCYRDITSRDRAHSQVAKLQRVRWPAFSSIAQERKTTEYHVRKPNTTCAYSCLNQNSPHAGVQCE